MKNRFPFDLVAFCIFVALAAAGGLAPAVYGAATGTLNWSITPASTGCSPGPCPLGVPAPSGFHWVLTVDDEFTQDTSLNTSLWVNGGNSDTLYFNSEGLNLQPTSAVANCSGGGSCNPGIGSTFFPRYGFWEWSLRYPSDVSGEGDGYHLDTYINNNTPGTDRIGYQEQAVGGETVMGTGSGNVGDFYCCGNSTDGNATVDVQIPRIAGGLSTAFHTYGAWWANDGTGNNGSASEYFDGSALYTGGRVGDWWGSGGAAIIMNNVSCLTSPFDGGNPCGPNTATSGNPYTFQYFRMWQLAAN